MKVKALIVLSAFAMTLFMPFQITLHTTADRNDAPLLTLDVCHAAGSSMFVQADMAFLYECYFELSISKNSWSYEIPVLPYRCLLVVLQKERPPRV